MGGALLPTFLAYFRNCKSYQSRKVDGNEDFQTNMLDLAIIITTFCDVVSFTMDIHETISTHRVGGWGQDEVTLQGVLGNLV